MANVIKIQFEYTDFYSDKNYKFYITHDRHYGSMFHKTNQALKDFKHYCNTNERLYNLGKYINRFTKICLIRKTGTISHVYEVGQPILTYEEWLNNKNTKKKTRKERYSLKIE